METALLLLGLFIGAIVGALWGRAALRGRVAREAAEVQSQANAAKAVQEELRAQYTKVENAVRQQQEELTTEREGRVRAETQLREAMARYEEEKKLLEEAKRKLSDAFKALSDDALKSNNQAFLELAKKTLDAVLADARGDLGKREEAVSGLVKPLSESLKRYEEGIRALEEKRQNAYGRLDEQIKALAGAQQQLQKETGNLVTALRKPQVRGRWGEMTLHNVVELAGMSEHCDYAEQVSVESDGERLRRPDMIVKLPAGREIVVDAKVALEAYLDALEAQDEETREALLAKHAQQIRTHMGRLSEKSYWSQFERAPEFVVMFIPADSFLAAAADRSPRLIEEGMRSRVVLATPTTLIALLLAVAYGWRQEKLTEHAQAISKLGKELYERMATFAGHVEDMSKALEKTNQAFNRSIASLEARVFPSARRLRELGIDSGAEVAAIEPVETTPRSLSAPEVTEESLNEKERTEQS
ncbi:MAG: DNA recombination protein RmuC [Planctomycetota bacterium]